MSNDVGYPVLRTSDLTLAMATARRIMEFGRQEHSNVSLLADLHSVAAVLRLAEALPAGFFASSTLGRGPDGIPLEELPELVQGVEAAELPADPAAYDGLLPMEYDLFGVPIGSVEDAFAAAVDADGDPGSINWGSLYWPDAPEIGFHGDSKHAEVTLLLNTRTGELDEPADEYTVFLHTRSSGHDGHAREPYVHWLAGRLGLAVVGPGQHW